jgi:DNA replicative helicase MCM subunit Mcm2 (Cdc46/Mcm family)
MYISVQFRNKFNDFSGKTYDFEVVGGVPKAGAIIRMVSEDMTKKVCNGTRVKVVGVKAISSTSQDKVRCILASMDEPSISKEK